VTIGKPIAVVAGFLALLTYLLIGSRPPDPDPRARMQRALQAMQLHDAELNRDVLSARAGLLPNYDSLDRTTQDLSHDLATLESESSKLSREGAKAVRKEGAALAAAVKDKVTSIERLKSDTASLRNSIAYFNQPVRSLGSNGQAGRRAMELAALSNVMLRFVQNKEPGAKEEAEAAVSRVRALSENQPDMKPLAAHSETILRLLPNVDALLAGIVLSSTTERGEALQQAMLKYTEEGERHAQRFRLLLYVVGLILLGYVFYSFSRLRQRARELRRKEVQLIQANKMSSLGTLVSGVAHEINNPNQIVLMNSGVLAAAWGDAVAVLDNCRHEHIQFSLAGLPYVEMRETVSQLIGEIQDGARRMERIIRELKDFARPSANAHEWFQLNAVVRKALRLLTHLVHKKTDNFQVKLADDAPYLQGSSQQLEQIVVNLVMNALEALPDRRCSTIVTTFFDSERQSAGVEVQDEGIGIAEENIPRLGEPFFTTKQASGGTGLGLAIASSLVRAHNGVLTFESKPGKGTRARVEFPCPPVTASSALSLES
jgi:signal transduction histidine kinase